MYEIDTKKVLLCMKLTTWYRLYEVRRYVVEYFCNGHEIVVVIRSPGVPYTQNQAQSGNSKKYKQRAHRLAKKTHSPSHLSPKVVHCWMAHIVIITYKGALPGGDDARLRLRACPYIGCIVVRRQIWA